MKCVVKAGEMPKTGDRNAPNIRIRVFRKSNAAILNPCPIGLVQCRADKGVSNPYRRI
jgi:hypothetical protein